MPVVEPPLRLGVTLSLKGDLARDYRQFVAAQTDFALSGGQIVEALIRKGLRAWKEGQ